MAVEASTDPWFNGTKFKQGTMRFEDRFDGRRVTAYGPGGSFNFEPSGTGKNLSYDGVNTDYWIVKGNLTRKMDGLSYDGYHGVLLDKNKGTIEIVTPFRKNRQYEAQEDVAKQFYNPKITRALEQANLLWPNSKDWRSGYESQQKEFDSLQKKKGLFHFMNLTSGIQMKVLQNYAKEDGTDSLEEVLWGLYSQDGSPQFLYGVYIGKKQPIRYLNDSAGQGFVKGREQTKANERYDAWLAEKSDLIEAVEKSGVSMTPPGFIVSSDDKRSGDDIGTPSNWSEEIPQVGAFYNVAFQNYDKKSNPIGPDLTWDARINAFDAFKGTFPPESVLTSADNLYVPKNTRDNPVKFNSKSSFQFSRTYLVDVGTKKKQRVTYKSRKAGDGLVIWKNQSVAKLAASAARQRGYLMRTVPVSEGWVNLAAKRKNYPDWHPLYSKHNERLMATGNLPKNLRGYHRR